MAKQSPGQLREIDRETSLMQVMAGFFDAEWYRGRYPDTAVAGLDPLLHFIRHGIAERRDPNRFFDGDWYAGHYLDVSVAGLHPLLHYLQSGAAELRNPHPNFDAAWYAGQHPEAAANPLTYHVKTGQALGFCTEKPIGIHDYLPSQRAALALPRKVVVDVVIPVHGAPEETKRCIASVLADTAKPLGRVIVVDDCSPQPELSAWLRDLAAQGLIQLIRNPVNVGFTTSANRGMDAAAPHDVALLNSDTEVPPGWVGRLAAHAYAHPRIASVSPFSNNATICGYPDNHGGPMAFGKTVRELDDACRAENAGRWVDVPTNVGFCMYIRRKALAEAGNFDARRFTVGYGEENDFCLRASALGWSHRLACDIFVHHKGSVSFGDRATALSNRAMDLVLEKYPAYLQDVARHVSLGAVEPFRFAITAGLFRCAGLPVILMVAHDLGGGGGVRRHIHDLVERCRDTARILLLEATDRGATLSVPSMPRHPTLALPKERLGDLALVLRSMKVTRAHVHHLLGMDLDIRALVRELGVPFDVTVHDYYAICPQINLLPQPGGLYCGEPDAAGCNACIAQRSSHGARDILTWRADHAWQFKDAARVLCPSNDVISRLQRHGLAGKAVLAPHQPVAPSVWKLRVSSPGGGKLRIAVLGALADHKGGRTVAALAELADPGNTEIHLIGHTDGPFSETALKRMKVTGQYDDADLAGMIETIAPHVIWFPAAWPETFSYTLSAAIDAGVPIAATRIGAFPERLTERPFTWLLGLHTSPRAWVEAFEKIRADLCGAAGPSPAPTLPALTRLALTRPAIKDYYASDYLHPPHSAPSRGRPPQPRIVVLPERFASGTPTPCGYIRLLQPLAHPATIDGFDVRVTTADTVFDCAADIIVTQRFAVPSAQAADRLAAHARRHGATLVFDLDDELLNIPRSHPEARALRPQSSVVRHMLGLADVVWVPTQAFAQRLSPTRPGAMVMENRLDERIWKAPAPPSQGQPVRILYMGTTTHDRDFAMVAPALSRLKAEYGVRVAIDVLGVTSRNDLPAGIDRVTLPLHAQRSYPGFVNWLTSAQPGWHIGIAPLLDTPFNACKSPIKAMDYAALGMAVVASDTGVYQGSIADGPAGRLAANTPAAWYAALNRLVRDPGARHAAAAQAREAFLAQASLASHVETRRGALLQLLASGKRHAAA